MYIYIYILQVGNQANRPRIRRITWLISIRPIDTFFCLNGSDGPNKVYGLVGLVWAILGLTKILKSRDWFSKELSGFDDVFSSPYFIIGLSLRADQIGCLQFAPSFFKNWITYGKRDLWKIMMHDKVVNTKKWRTWPSSFVRIASPGNLNPRGQILP